MKRKVWSFEARLDAVRARQRGLSCEEVGRLTGMSREMICRYVMMHRRGGVSALRPKMGAPKPGPEKRSV